MPPPRGPVRLTQRGLQVREGKGGIRRNDNTLPSSLLCRQEAPSRQTNLTTHLPTPTPAHPRTHITHTTCTHCLAEPLTTPSFWPLQLPAEYVFPDNSQRITQWQVRREASPHAKPVGSLKTGERVIVTERRGVWLRVRLPKLNRTGQALSNLGLQPVAQSSEGTNSHRGTLGRVGYGRG